LRCRIAAVAQNTAEDDTSRALNEELMDANTKTLFWIIGSGVVMSLIALTGSILFLLTESVLQKVLLPMVAFSAGALIGGGLFHLIPASVAESGNVLWVMVWTVAGFTVFFALEQFLHWHHCGRAESDCRKPLTYLILAGDGLHNFIGGLAIAGTFLLDIRLGIAAWLAAAAHELPQELGDMSVLLYGGWSKKGAMLWNFLSALTFLAGGIVAYAVSFGLETGFLIPFAAGNFIYIGASDLIPEVNRHKVSAASVISFTAFVFGLALLYAFRIWLE
jgi:zinc and cadmium transporter